MNVLLIGINSKYIHPALAIYQLKENLNLDYINAITKEFTIKNKASEIIDFIDNGNFSLVCFSVYIWNVNLINEILKHYKKHHHNFKICLGGPEVSFEYDEYLKHNLCDYILRGEGEIPFRMLVKAIHDNSSLADVANLSYKENKLIIKNKELTFPLDNIKLATLSVPDYQNRIVYLEASRGCPFKCSYCLASTSNKVRYFDLDHIKTILKELIDNKTKQVKFLDRTFNARPEYTKDIISFINEHNVSTSFQFEIVVDRLTDELMELITSSKNFPMRFEIGIQTMNNEVNEAINRHQNNDLLIKNIETLNKLDNVDLHLDLIAGLPYETHDMFVDSFNKVFRLNPKELQLGFLKCLKGTKLSEQKELYGYKFSKFPPYEIIKNNYMSKSDLAEIHLAEEALDLVYNSNRFKHTFEYIISKYYNSDFYNILLDIANFFKEEKFDFHQYQLHNLYAAFFLFMLRYSFNDAKVAYLIKKDYLLNYKTKPKKWWRETDAHKKLVNQVLEENSNTFKDRFHRYAVSISYENHIFIVFYHNFNPVVVEFDV